MESFINKHQDSIVGTLSCFDRVLFKGYLPITHEKGGEALFYDQQGLIKQFKYRAPQLSRQIAEYAENYAALNQRPFMGLNTKTNKEKLARDLAKKEGLTQGLVAVFKVLEPCRSFRMRGGKRRPHLKAQTRKCNFFYFYFLDREFGLMHVGLQSWLPFLGKKLHGNFKGELITDYKVRTAGARVTHRMKGNWIKMYDKYGLVLRIETVINQPREFNVFGQGIRQGEWVYGWFPMAKRVTHLPRYFEISVKACQRYLDALRIVEDPRQAYDDLHDLTRSRVRSGRQARGLNPRHLDDAQLFAAVLRGEHRIKGFRNKDVVRVLYPSKPSSSKVAKRRSRKVTRLPGILWTHGVIAKIPRSRRWRVTDKGRRLMTGTVVLRNQDLPERLVG